MKKYLFLFLLSVAVFGCDEDPNRADIRSMIKLSKIGKSANGKVNGVVTNPNGGTFEDGDVVSIEFGFIVCACDPDWISEYLDIYLVKGGNYEVIKIADRVPFGIADYEDWNYQWTIPFTGIIGNDFSIKIVDSDNSDNYNYSSNFTINHSGIGTSFSQAFDWGTISGSSCQGKSGVLYDFNPLFSNSYGGLGDDIYYKFTLANAANVEIGTCDELHDFALYLFDQNENLILQAPFVNPYELGGCERGSLLHSSLSAGTYYIISSGLQDGTFVYPYDLLTFMNVNCRTY